MQDPANSLSKIILFFVILMYNYVLHHQVIIKIGVFVDCSY